MRSCARVWRRPGSSRRRGQPWWTGPAAHDLADPHVGQLGSGPRAAQQEPAAAHVAPTDEVEGESQPRPQGGQQGLDVLAGGDAAEQNDLAAGPEAPGQPAGVAVQRLAIARIVAVDVDGREAPQARNVDRLVGWPQTVGRCDDEHARVGRLRDGARVRELAAKVETAQEREDLAERHAGAVADALGEIERRALTHDQPRAQPAAVSGRQEEDPAHGRPVGATDRANSWAVAVFSTSPRRTQPRRAMATP